MLRTALHDWTRCLLLREALVPKVPAILVETLAVATDEEGENTIDCRYIATVEEAWVDVFDDDDYEDYHYDTIRLGHPNAGDEGVDIRGLIHDSDDDLVDDESEISSDDLWSESDDYGPPMVRR